MKPIIPVTKCLINQALRLARDEAGNVAMIFGMALVPLLIAVGAALDLTQQTRLEQKMAGTADAIALAAARSHDDMQNRDSIGQIFLDANLDSGYEAEIRVTSFNVSFDDAAKLVRVNLVAEIPTILMGIVGIETMTTTTNSTVSYDAMAAEPVSLALVLDVSGSMDWDGKIDTLRTAATRLLDQLDRADPDDVYVRTGLVTYDTDVRQSVRMGWSIDNTRPVVQTLVASGGTASTNAIAMASGWLRGNSEYTQHQRQSVHNGQTFELNKFMIFMTDGSNNNSRDDVATRQLCDQTKNGGIEVFSVAFDAPLRGQDLLRYCATDADHYYDAADADAFLLAFDEIAEHIQTALVRIVE